MSVGYLQIRLGNRRGGKGEDKKKNMNVINSWEIYFTGTLLLKANTKFIVSRNKYKAMDQ